MNKRITALIIAGLLFAPCAFAHPDHESAAGPQKVAQCRDISVCSRDEISSAAENILSVVTKSGQLPETWNKYSKPTDVSFVSIKAKDFWLSRFDNSEAPNPEESHFYILISEDGYLAGMNFNPPDGISASLGIPKQIIGLSLIGIFSASFYFLVLRRRKGI